MNRISLAAGLFLFVVTLVCLSAPTDSRAGLLMGGDSMASGVYCEINGASLFAKSAEDCATAGGTVTHSVKTEVTPMDDNPNEEPEIQRTKDKEPEAP